MKVGLLIFGQLTEDIDATDLELGDQADTNALYTLLLERYPSLRTKSFTIAVNNKLVVDNTPLTENNTIALMPPFSGG